MIGDWELGIPTDKFRAEQVELSGSVGCHAVAFHPGHPVNPKHFSVECK